MLEWVEHVLAPYVATCPTGILSILFLDSFKVHFLGSVGNAIQSLGVELEFIPAGCTGLVQPIGIGFNKPYKAAMSQIYTNFMMGQDVDALLQGATHHNVSGWILEAVGSISKETVINSWRNTRFLYFLDWFDVMTRTMNNDDDQ